MKTLIFRLLIILTCPFIIGGCLGIVEAGIFHRQYQIMNNSESNIKIKFFDTFSNDSSEIEIGENKLYKGNLLEYREGNHPQLSENNSFFPNRAYKDADSLVIIFDNIKLLSQYYRHTSPFEVSFSNPKDRNLFKHGNYERLGKEDIFQFTITQQDYENAEDCNGNCE